LNFEILSDSFETSLDNRHYSTEPEIKALNLMIKVTMAGFVLFNDHKQVAGVLEMQSVGPTRMFYNQAMSL
jgi:hypothetical protein